MLAGSEDDAEGEVRPLAVAGADPNFSVEALDQILRDHETEADSLGVHPLRIRDLAKQFKQFPAILSRYSDASINDRDHNFVILWQRAVQAFQLVVAGVLRRLRFQLVVRVSLVTLF